MEEMCIRDSSILGGLSAYPIAILLMGANAGSIAFYAYIVPFFISTLGGAIISVFVIGEMCIRDRCYG